MQVNTPQRKPEPAESGQLSINLAGPPELVLRMLAALAGTAEGTNTGSAPEPILLTRADATARTGIPEHQLSGLVKLGKLHNYGQGRKLLLSLSEIRAWVAEQA